MLPIVSNDLGTAAMKEVMSLAVLILVSGMLVFNEGLSSAVFRTFRIMVLEVGVLMVL